MDTKPVIEKVVTALVTAVILGVAGYFMGVFDKGQEAISEDQIEAVLKRALVTDAGKTYGETLAEVNGTLIAIDTKVGIIQHDVDKLETAVRELAQ